MATYLLDSSVIIDTLNGKNDRKSLLKNLLLQRHVLACCAVNVVEVFAGMRPSEEKITTSLLSQLEYYDVTWEVARKAGLLRNKWMRKGHTLSFADVTIAAVVLSYNLTLITDNVKHYPMPELKIHGIK